MQSVFNIFSFKLKKKGSELIDWFLTHVSIRTRNEAKEYAEELIREGYLEGIGSKTVKENTILRLPVFQHFLFELIF